MVNRLGRFLNKKIVVYVNVASKYSQSYAEGTLAAYDDEFLTLEDAGFHLTGYSGTEATELLFVPRTSITFIVLKKVES